jgi:DNA-binding MarR family transcriptional regulator
MWFVRRTILVRVANFCEDERMTDTQQGSAGAARPELVDALVQSAFQVVAELTRVAARHDLSLTQLRLLGILRDRQRVRIGDLGTHLGLGKSTLSGLIDRAERRGLVRRLQDDVDRRATDVALTPDGRRLAGELVADVSGRVSLGLELLSADEREQLRALLSRAAGAR